VSNDGALQTSQVASVRPLWTRGSESPALADWGITLGPSAVYDGRSIVPHFNPFDMDMDGDIDGIDFLGFDYLMRYVVGRKEDKDDEELGPDDEPADTRDDCDY
jgi:hypothetical protein